MFVCLYILVKRIHNVSYLCCCCLSILDKQQRQRIWYIVDGFHFRVFILNRLPFINAIHFLSGENTRETDSSPLLVFKSDCLPAMRWVSSSGLPPVSPRKSWRAAWPSSPCRPASLPRATRLQRLTSSPRTPVRWEWEFKKRSKNTPA